MEKLPPIVHQPISSTARWTIGLIIGTVYQEIPKQVWWGVADAAARHNLNLVCFAGGALHDHVVSQKQDHILYDLIDASLFDGLLVMPSSIGFAVNPAEMAILMNRFKNFPIITIDDAVEGIPCVIKDNYQGMHMVINHLVEGHKCSRIAFMHGPAQYIGAQERYHAYRDVLDQHRLPYDERLVTPIPSSWQINEAIEVFRDFLADNCLQPGVDFDAVAAANDEMALGIIAVLRQRGTRVPEEVAVTGFDDLEVAGVSLPPLTTIRPPFYEMGLQAVEMLTKYLMGEEVPHRLVMRTALAIRRSCGCLLPAITHTVPHIPSRTPRRVKNMTYSEQISAHEDEILAQVNDVLPASPSVVAWTKRLLQACGREIDDKDEQLFLSVFEEVLGETAFEGGNLEDWRGVLSVIYHALSRYAPDARAQQHVRSLFSQAHILVSEIVWRFYTQGKLRIEESYRSLHVLSARLSASLSLEELVTILANELPQLGILRCYISLYENTARPRERSKLLMAFEDGKLVALPVGGSSFPSRRLFPQDLHSYPASFCLLVEALFFRDEPLGFVIFDTSQAELRQQNTLFDALRVQVSSSVKAAQLYHEVEMARQQAELGLHDTEERRKAAEEANQLKSRFLSMVSHELRTPLNVIAGLSENLILDREIPPRLLSDIFWRDLERIHASAQHLDNLIRDVLDLASSQVGQLKLIDEPLNIAEALNPVLVIGERLAREKGLAWRVDLPEQLPMLVWDRTRLRQVILNLVTNAVKFTEEGQVWLRVEAGDNVVRFVVSDTGLGIPEDEQETIFEEFHRSERSSARGYGGMGLGLAICRRLVEMGHGEIWVHSPGDLGKGSTFAFTLPCSQTPLMPLELGMPTPGGIFLIGAGEGSDFLYQQLVRDGYEVDKAKLSDQEGLMRRLVAYPPAAIILDFDPEQEQGWGTWHALKRNPVTQEIPILFYRQFQEAGRGAVFELDYLSKPLNQNRLAQALGRYGLTSGDAPDGKIILIVDDEQNTLDLHAALVHSQLPHSRILFARDGLQALEAMKQCLPDLVLLDLMMPVMDGFTVLENMRRSEAARGVPVIVLTSHHLTETEMERLNQGVAAVMEKGLFRADETLSKIEAVLARNKSLGSEARRIARRAMAYIHEHYAENITRKVLAAHVGVSEAYLSTCFRREIGVSPTTYVERYRIKQAKVLLETTQQSITQVALEVGFCDSSYFGRVFHKEVGVSPNAYRRQGNRF